MGGQRTGSALTSITPFFPDCCRGRRGHNGLWLGEISRNRNLKHGDFRSFDQNGQVVVCVRLEGSVLFGWLMSRLRGQQPVKDLSTRYVSPIRAGADRRIG